MWVFFFFQAEDGIRDKLVTGVQTCALPILHRRMGASTERSTSAAATRDRGPARSNRREPRDLLARRPSACPRRFAPRGEAPAGGARAARAFRRDATGCEHDCGRAARFGWASAGVRHRLAAFGLASRR